MVVYNIDEIRKGIFSRHANMKFILCLKEASLGPILLTQTMPERTVIFSFNVKGRLTLNLTANATVNPGKTSSLEIVFSLFNSEAISIKEINEDDRTLAMIVHLKPKPAVKIIETLDPELQQLLQDRIRDRPIEVEYVRRNLLLVFEKMKDFNPPVYMRVEMPPYSPAFFDARETVDFMCEEFKKVIIQDFQSHALNVTCDFIERIPQSVYNEFLLAMGLSRVDVLRNGDSRLVYFDYNDNPNSYMIKTQVLKPTASVQPIVIKNMPVKRPYSGRGESIISNSQQSPYHHVVPKKARSYGAQPVLTPETFNEDTTVKQFLMLHNKKHGMPDIKRRPRKTDVVSICDDEESPAAVSSATATIVSPDQLQSTSTTVAPKLGKNNTEVVLQYPPVNKRDIHSQYVTLSMDDIKTLDPAELINDFVLEFYFIYLKCEIWNEQLREKIHIFNSFMFTRLTQDMLKINKVGQRVYTLQKDKLMKNFEFVKKWTKKVDIYAKDYIILPVNEELHWMAVIIVNPRGALLNAAGKPIEKHNAYIVYLDSMTGMDARKQNLMCNILTEYLRLEFNDKKERICAKLGSDKNLTFDPSRVVSFRPKNLPIQRNLLDCGAYAVHFVETFFGYNNPLSIEKLPNVDWREEFPLCDELALRKRFKIFAAFEKSCEKNMRSRLEKYELERKIGMYNHANRLRGHSANMIHRHRRPKAHYGRHFSIGTAHSYMDTAELLQPHLYGNNPLAREVRRKEVPYFEIPTFC